MKTTVIIPCAGPATRWNHFLGLPKQLTPMPGSEETIIARTIRLLREQDLEDIFVITHDPEIEAALQNVSIIHPASRKHLTDTILSSKSVWNDRTVVLLGDVIFTRNAIETIVIDQKPLCFYGLLEESPIVKLFGYRKEVFGFAFHRKFAREVESALKRNSVLGDLREAGSSRLLWDLDRVRFLLSNEFRFSEEFNGKGDLFSWLLKFNYPPEPPHRIRRLNFPRTSAWRLLRKALPLVGGGNMFFGKLWGVYAILAQINPAKEGIRTRRTTNSDLFNEISDFTQDCDSPRDLERLSLLQDFFKWK